MQSIKLLSAKAGASLAVVAWIFGSAAATPASQDRPRGSVNVGAQCWHATQIGDVCRSRTPENEALIERERIDRGRRAAIRAARIEEETRRLGPHRRAEAIAIVDLQERARAARNGPGSRNTQASNEPGIAAPSPNERCTPISHAARTYTVENGLGGQQTEAAAIAAAIGDLRAACGGRGGSLGSQQCRSVGTVGGRFHQCRVVVQCAAYTETDCGTRVTRQ